MAVLNATNVTLSIAGEVMSHCTSCSFSITRDLRDKTSKQSGGWTEQLEGLMSWEMSGDGFIDLDDGSGKSIMSDAFTKLTAVSPEIQVIFTVGTSGDTYTGQGFVTSVSADAGVEESATYSVSITGTGQLTQVIA